MATINKDPVSPKLQLPAAKIADIGKVRIGDGTITGEFPSVRLPRRKVADPGNVRLGDGTITGVFA